MKISTLYCFVLVATLFVVTSLADEDVSGGILLMFYYNSLLMPVSKVFDLKEGKYLYEFIKALYNPTELHKYRAHTFQYLF